MAMGNFNAPNHQMPTAEINMTPLVDVMLVLLIIFIITAPLMTHSVKVELPRASSTPTPEKPATLQVAINADNKVFVGSEAVDRTRLEQKFRDAVARDANVEMHLKADKATRYESVAETMSAARRAGLSKIGFVTQPANE
ncbi:MAG: outer rane transport energization protein ExbD [Proteobacteria bacterium]|nr:outer rane transport energization protein ExbD [Pseudomonadota bacterium]